MKKILCILLSACLLICGCAVPTIISAAEPESNETVYTHTWDSACKTDCNGKCGANPIIVVPGIMQSQVYVQDENGNDLMTSDGFPIVEGMDMAFMFDMVKLKEAFKGAIGDILKAVFTGDRDTLFDIVLGILDESFASHYFNADGTRVNDVDVDEYWYSIEESRNRTDKSYNYAKGYSKDDEGNTLPTKKYPTEFDFIMKQVNISGYCNEYGYDHAYYYAYSSFGDTLTHAQALGEYIDMVKAQTGHDKVNIVFISLGGTIGSAYLAEYCDPSEIDRIVFAAAAVNGSYLLGDLMAGASTLEDGEIIYNELIPNIVALAADEYMALAYAGNTIARIIPQELFSDFLSEALTRAIDEVVGKLIHNCPSMWALTPGDMYPDLSAKYLSDAAHAQLKAVTDRYYNIQKNAASTLQKLTAEGMEIFVVCGYNLELPALIEHYNLSSDNIIQSSSTSIGATFADVGKTLAEDYVPAIDSSYISPDGIVDAGTCALPDRTWFIKNQSHLKLQSSVNDTIELCVQIALDKDITDSRVNNGGYPQFNEYRNLQEVEKLMRKYGEADLASLSADKRDAVNAAYADAEALLASRTWSQAETDTVEEALYTAMYNAKLLSDGDSSPTVVYKLLPTLEKILKFFSDVFEFIFRGNDYWLLPVYIP